MVAWLYAQVWEDILSFIYLNIFVVSIQGDSGGPLFQGSSPNEVIIGVVSWGVLPCGSNNLPSGVFKRVSGYIDWIEQHTGIRH